MLQFKEHYLIKEYINKTDIIDLYILMSMPTPMEDHNKFIRDEVVKKTRSSIQGEIENVILREMRHLFNESQEYADGVSEIYSNDFYQDYKKPYIYDWDGDYTKDGEPGPIPPAMEKNLQILFKKMFGIPKADVGDVYHRLKQTETYLHKIFGHSYSGSNKKETSSGDLSYETGLPWTMENTANIFSNLKWYGGFGGKAWGRIANQAAGLRNASPGEFFPLMDRFVDMVHNNGTIMNKFKGYHEGWLMFILDLKQQATNIRDLIPYASKDVKKLFRDPAWRLMMIKIPGMGAQEGGQETIINLFNKYMKDIIIMSKRWNNDVVDVDYLPGGREYYGKKAWEYSYINKVFQEFGTAKVVQTLQDNITDKTMKKNIKAFLKLVKGNWKNVSKDIKKEVYKPLFAMVGEQEPQSKKKKKKEFNSDDYI